MRQEGASKESTRHAPEDALKERKEHAPRRRLKGKHEDALQQGTSLSLHAIRLQALGAQAYTRAARLSSVCCTRHRSDGLPFPSMQSCAAPRSLLTSLRRVGHAVFSPQKSRHIINIRLARH